MRVRLALAGTLALLAFASAPAMAQPPGPLDAPIVTNLDGDPEPERLVAREVACFRDGESVPPPCREGDARELLPAIVDTCNGQPVTHELFTALGQPDIPTVQFITVARVLDTDGDPGRPEVFVEGRAGASGRVGQSVLVRMTDVPGACPRPRRLFQHPNTSFSGRRLRGGYPSLGVVRIRDFVRRFPGREVRLEIPFYRRRDAGCCPSMLKTVWLRYDRTRDLYVRYRTRANRHVRRST